MSTNSEAFLKLKPLCNNVLKFCTFENINELENLVKKLDSDSVESLMDYIALPLIVHLKQKETERITIKCIKCLSLVFEKGKMKNMSFFVDIFAFMLSQICNLQEMNQVSDASEELKISVCENMLCLVQFSTEEVLNEMYSLSFRPFLAQALFAFKILLNNERSKDLLKAVLRVIGGFLYNKDYLRVKYEKTKIIASEALASCLPGLSSSLERVICGDDNQVHSVIIMALGILIDFIVLTVGSDSFKRNISHDSSSDVYHTCYKSNYQKANIPVVIKNEAWYKSVSPNLEIIIRNIKSVANHRHYKVRLEFLKCSESLIFKCADTLSNCLSILLPSVFALSVDDNEVVSSHAKNILSSLSKKLQNSSQANFNSVIEDNIESLTSQLIKCQFSLNDDKKLITLKSLLGYIEISESSLNKLLFSITCFERIIMALITLLEFNASELNVVEEIPITENFEINLTWPKKRFKFFENEHILTTICKLCHSLGRIGNSRLLIDYLLEKIATNGPHMPQCIFIIGNIIEGLVKEPDAPHKYSALVGDVLEALLSNSLLDVPIHTHDSEDSQKQAEELCVTLSNNALNHNKLQICLILEAVASCSGCLGNGFQAHLMKVLCRVMEKAGSSSSVISQSGQICLYHIAQSCKYKSVQELIKENADYIINIIMIDFYQYLLKPETATVLRVAMELSDAEALVLFRDLIFHILDHLDCNQAQAFPLLKVLLSVAMRIKKWFPCKRNLQNKETSRNTSTKSLKTLMAEYIRLKQICDSGFENESQDLSNEENAGSDNESSITQNESHVDCDIDERKTDVPLHVTVTSEIFKRCIHLQASPNRFVRMLTLEIVEQCILILRDHERQLQPLIHQFWSPFLRRFLEDTFVSKAFGVLVSIANECGDFIRSRTLKDVMPKLVLFLKKEYSKSLLKCNFKHYQWTTDHALQVLILSDIGNLCTKLDIDSKDINAVAGVCLPYLEKKQPKVLQDAATKSLKALSSIDRDSVWFYWNGLYSKENTLLPPHENLSKLYFPYSDNALTSVNVL